MRRLVLVGAGLLVPLAGCLSNEPGASAVVLGSGGPLEFGEPVDALTLCMSLCGSTFDPFEPSIAVGAAGIVAMNSGGQMARSTDGGRTFRPVATSPNGFEGYLVDWMPADAIVQADAEGAIWSVAMMVNGVYPELVNGERGPQPRLHVGRTLDAGLNWDLDVQVYVPMQEGTFPDRPWLAFGDGTVLLAYQEASFDVGVYSGWAMLSSDQGVSWRGPYATSPLGSHGRPVWDGNQFVLPFKSGHDAWVATSPDGKVWRQHRVGSDWYPQMPAVAADGQGTLWFAANAWVEALEARATRLSMSRDGGATWEDVVHPDRWLSLDGRFPWMEAHDGVVFVGAYGVEADGGASLHVLRIEAGVAQHGTAVDGLQVPERFTDFAHFALDGDEVLAIYQDAQHAWVVRGGTPRTRD